MIDTMYNGAKLTQNMEHMLITQTISLKSKPPSSKSKIIYKNTSSLFRKNLGVYALRYYLSFLAHSISHRDEGENCKPLENN